MAKKKNARKRRAISRARKDAGIGFHSWTFLLFLVFVLVATLILVAEQLGMIF
jgi:hypothetical protein